MVKTSKSKSKDDEVHFFHYIASVLEATEVEELADDEDEDEEDGDGRRPCVVLVVRRLVVCCPLSRSRAEEGSGQVEAVAAVVRLACWWRPRYPGPVVSA